MKLKYGKFEIAFILFLITAGFIGFFTYQNSAIGITNYKYVNAKLPEGFHGYKVVQISDLHNKNFNGRLSGIVKEAEPNIIVITGDLIDRRNIRIDIAIEFIEEIVKIAPIYYVSGNHEQLSGKYYVLKEELEKLNVQVIDNSYTILSQNGDEIGLMGIGDPSTYQNRATYILQNNSLYIEDHLKRLFKDANTDFNILLSHRPEQLSIYGEMGIDLAFSGHAHGGQIRIPLIGGLFAPGQGFFPKYTSGVHSKGETSMVVSRGLGNSIFPLRVYNPPELVVVTLEKH